MKIVLIEPLHVKEEIIQAFKQEMETKNHEFIAYSTKPQSPAEIIEKCGQAEIITLANMSFPAEIIEKLEALKMINVAFTGVDHIGKSALKNKNIIVSNAAGYSTTAVAELVLGLVLNLYRKISQQEVNLRTCENKPLLIGREIKGKTVGIIGAGKIGLETAQLFQAFGAKILVYNRTPKPELEEKGLQQVALEELLQKSDIISLHLPLTEKTKSFINTAEIALMKKSAILINCARGPIINEAALIEALATEKIQGAGIDVFDQEPPLLATAKILEAKNSILTPHIAYFTAEAMEKRAKIAFENIRAFLAGKPQNLVNLGE